MGHQGAIPIVRFGNTDLEVTRLCQGTAFRNMERSAVNVEGEKVLRRCIEAGINFFDSAIAYGWGGSEELLGKAIAGCRDHLVLCTKVPPATHPKDQGDLGEPTLFTKDYLETELENSLRRLGTDYLDFYLLHQSDSVTPPAEICDAMDYLVRVGKTRYWGVSNHGADEVRQLHSCAEGVGYSPPAAVEDYYTIAGISVLNEERQSRPRLMERELLPTVQELGIGVIAFSPMDAGHLSPDRDPEKGSPLATLCDTIDEVAVELSVSRAEVCVAWVLARPGVTSVLAGIEHLEHVDQMIAGTTLELAPELMMKLDEASHRFSDDYPGDKG